jgi:hypothetical protein
VGQCGNESGEQGVNSAAPPWEVVPGKTCDLNPLSLRQDLDRYPSVSRDDVGRAERLYGAHARRYVIQDNVLYARDCADNAIVGVSSFVEDMLVQLLKRVRVPDVDFVLNCSDYPQVRKSGPKEDAPVVSMCGSTNFNDIIVPTYTLALVVAGRRKGDLEAEKPWDERKNQMVWRGSDSNRDRFLFNKISNSPEFEATGLLDVGISKMVRVQHDPVIHGPVKPSMRERSFGDYKWIANVEGAVAAYRMPAVAALGSVIVKQDSHYMEHWYREFLPWTHYVPMKNNFSDVEEVLDWLQSHDAEAQKIGQAARQFALEHLTPEPVLCFWYVFLYEYAARMTYQPTILDDMVVVSTRRGRAN